MLKPVLFGSLGLAADSDSAFFPAGVCAGFFAAFDFGGLVVDCAHIIDVPSATTKSDFIIGSTSSCGRNKRTGKCSRKGGKAPSTWQEQQQRLCLFLRRDACSPALKRRVL